MTGFYNLTPGWGEAKSDPFYSDPSGWGSSAGGTGDVLSNVAHADHEIVERVGDGVQVTVVRAADRNRLHVVVDVFEGGKDFADVSGHRGDPMRAARPGVANLDRDQQCAIAANSATIA